MTVSLALIITTVLWAIIVWTGIAPILSLPVSRVKREYAQVLLLLGTIGVGVEWLTQREMHVVTLVSMAAFVLVAGMMIYLLRRLDYYVEDLLQELFILAVSAAGTALISSVWYWGITSAISLLLLRLIVAAIPVIYYLVAWRVAGQRHSLWSIGVYMTLLLIKWVTFPAWGVWSVLLLLLYSILVGYVLHWMSTTTYAEKVFSWNIEPAKVWSLLVLSAGLLVLFF